MLQIVAPLRDAATGLPQYFFASLGVHVGHRTCSPPPTQIVDAALQRAWPCPPSPRWWPADGWVGADPAQPGLGYLSIAERLRELRWSAGAISVDAASLHAFGSLGLAVYSLPDGDALWY